MKRELYVCCVIVQEWAGIKKNQQIAGSKQQQTVLHPRQFGCEIPFTGCWTLDNELQLDRTTEEKSTDGSKQRAHIWLRESPQQIPTDGGYGNRMLLVWIVWSCISGPHSFLTAVIRSRGHAHQTKEIRAVRCCCSYTGPRTMILDQSVMCKHCCRAHLSSVSGVGWENYVGFMLTPVN